MGASKGYFLQTLMGGALMSAGMPLAGRSSYHLDRDPGKERRSRNPKARRHGRKLRPNRRIVSKRVRAKHRRARRAA